MYASIHKALKRKWILPDIQSGKLFQKGKERNNSGIFYSSGGRYFIWLLAVVFLFSSGDANAQDTLPVNYKARRIALGTSSALLTGSSLLYLNQVWYQQYNTGSFHWFNDNGEWYGLDKAGHAFTTYQTGRLMMGAFEWAGYSRKQKIGLGGTMGLAYMTVIEVMDGYSRGWGFSWGDMGANAIGTALATGQELAWREQRIQLKFSFWTSGLAKYNPSLLGKSGTEQILKDYNGQTHWLSINPSQFMSTSAPFPKWLSIAFGYGAQNMIGARNNPTVLNADGNVLTFPRYQQYYLSLDVQLDRIPTRSRFLKRLFSVIGILKFPAPAIEWRNGKLKGHYLFF
ncbi:MAG: DUF2279 domain-containing protein [Sediminibacterium sp.]|nr:DUF2279 domain-containing protein [Sediminibacterium sp.]